MSVTNERISQILRGHIPRPFQRIRVEPLPGDASNRRYHRLFLNEGRSGTLIMMELADPENFKASEEKISGNEISVEELPFVNVQRFLHMRGVGVPSLYHYEISEGLIFLEDLGDMTLEVLIQNKDGESVRDFYFKAIDELLLLQSGDFPLKKSCIAFQRSFESSLFMWEFEHFLEYGIEARTGRKIPDAHRGGILEYFKKISDRLADEPRCLTHRDFHSRNLMISGGRIRVIDFQDALLGPYHYDLASLLRDSYVRLPEHIVDRCVDYFLEKKEKDNPISIDQKAFREMFDLMSIQRNLKAAGRFVYIDRVKENPRFLPFVEPTLRRVGKNLKRYPSLRPLFSLLQPYVEEFRSP